MSKWMRAPKKQRCQHQNIELLKKEGKTEPASRMGFTMVNCVTCDASWWEPNSNLRTLGYIQ